MLEKIVQRLKSKKIEKGWGYELHIVNNDMYCGKILHFNQDGEMSMHYHMEKHETFYVLSGILYLRGIDHENAEPYEIEIKPGDVIEIKPGVAHKLIAHTEAEIFEVSTPDFYEDNFRIQKGDSQK